MAFETVRPQDIERRSMEIITAELDLNRIASSTIRKDYLERFRAPLA